MTEYFDQIKEFIPDIQECLRGKGIDDRHLIFGGELPEERIVVPTDARSEFLANRAMGDWAEGVLAEALRSPALAVEVSHYGDTEKMAAGEAGFKEAYKKSRDETRRYGKRPDLLVFPRGSNVPSSLSDLSRQESDNFAKKALAGIEVRSSKFKAEKYMSVRKQDRATKGMPKGRETPSFTVKVEDLRVVFRWIEVTGTQQAYAQVFFDSCYAINMLAIFEAVASSDTSRFRIEAPEKSQNKATIMIPITQGVRIGVFSGIPNFAVEVRETRLGRVDAYVRPEGGDLRLERKGVEQVLGSPNL
jgi:hypothetical protein